jgi:nucleotide-binding universal stress UspA family protein
MPIKRVLCASDFSEASRPALALAREMAVAFGADLIVFHAYQVTLPATGMAALPEDVYKRAAAAARAQARRVAAQLARSVQDADLRVRVVVAEGPPAETIVGAAAAKRVDLLVLGTHGRTGLKRAILGSVAEEVLRTAACPVVTVRAITGA